MVVSAWTQALAYQTFRSLADAIRPVDVMLGAELDTLAVTVKDAFDHLLIQKSVPNARIRQSNMYFSSSEGAFDDRYAYARDFHLLKEGKIEVKGGWRLYSSGPGIYMRQLIANVLGIRFCEKGLILDPVISEDLFGATFTYECYGRTLHFCYQHSEDGTVYAVSGGSRLPAEVLPNPYRRGGILLAEDIVNNCAEIINLYC